MPNGGIHREIKDNMNDLNDRPSQIPVDDEYFRHAEIDEDANSAYSIASSKYNYTWENGRQYLDYRSGHPFPYDNISHENEEVLHSMMLFILNNENFVAPLDGSSLRNVLDIGTGLGLWAEDMAEKYPHCHVIGMDTAPQPNKVLPNYEFILMDVTHDWLFGTPDLKFDFIHIRSLFASITDPDWLPLYQRCYDHLEPGGWIQQCEVEIKVMCDDSTADPNSQLVKLAKLTETMSDKFGKNFGIATTMRDQIQEAGFVDVEEARHKLPVGWWSANPRYREIGRFFERFYKSGLQGWLMHILTKTMNYGAEEVNEECLKAFREIDSREHHYYFNLVIVIGRKPTTSPNR